MQGEFIARSGWRYHWEVNTVQIPWEIYTHEFSVDGNQPSAAAGKPGSNLLDGLLSLLQVHEIISASPMRGGAGRIHSGCCCSGITSYTATSLHEMCSSPSHALLIKLHQKELASPLSPRVKT